MTEAWWSSGGECCERPLEGPSAPPTASVTAHPYPFTTHGGHVPIVGLPVVGRRRNDLLVSHHDPSAPAAQPVKWA
jgi:hypothetical protein